MAKQEKRMKHLLLDILMLVSLLPMGGSQVAQAQGIPEPFPEDCDDITPVADACCMRGYVYYGGAPVDAADVHIESAYGQVDLATASGGESTDPYYSVVLSDAPLSLSPGEVITITASYSDMVSTRTWTVQSNGQHVDLGLVAGYQAAEPVPIETGADRSQDGAGNWGQVKQLTASGGAVYGILDESVAASSVPAAPQLMHFEAGGHVPGIEPTRLYLDALDHALSAEFLNTAVGACDSHYALTTGPTYVWHTFYGSGARDGAGAIAADGSGNIYIVGTSYATWQGDGGANPLHAYGGGPNDIVVTKLNSSGAYQWHTFYGAGGDDRGHAIAVDGSGNVYVTGLSSSTWQGDGGANPLHAFSGGEYDIVVLKLNSDGDYQWHTFYGPGGGGLLAKTSSWMEVTTFTSLDIVTRLGKGMEAQIHSTPTAGAGRETLRC
jgi:hypothetical protein